MLKNGVENVRKIKRSVNSFLDRLIPFYSRVPLTMVVIVNFSVYWGSRLIAADRYHYHMATALDERIPLIPWTVVIYFGCYLFWVVNYILSGQVKKEQAYRFCAADIFAKIICFFCYTIIPTTLERPTVAGSGAAEQMIAWLYQIDAADNLFPSIHCLVSWFCYIGIRKQDRIPTGYRRFSCFFAILVCISTVTTKQHVIVDVFAGVLLAEASYAIMGKWFRKPNVSGKAGHTNGKKSRGLRDGINMEKTDGEN